VPDQPVSAEKPRLINSTKTKQTTKCEKDKPYTTQKTILKKKNITESVMSYTTYYYPKILADKTSHQKLKMCHIFNLFLTTILFRWFCESYMILDE